MTKGTRLFLALIVTGYAIFIWRSPYGYRYFPVHVLDWVIPTVGIGVWAITGLHNKHAWPRTHLDWPILAWWAVTAWSVLFSVNRRVSMHAAWETVIGALILWLLVEWIRRGHGMLLWQTLYLLAGVVCLISGLEFVAWYMGWPIFSFLGPGWFPIGGLANPIPPVLHRLVLAPVNDTSLAALMALLIPPALAIGLETGKRDTRIGVMLWVGAAIATMVLSLTRGGFLALGVSLPFFALGALFEPRIRHMLSAFWARRIGRLALVGALVLGMGGLVGGGFMLAARMAGHRSGDQVRLDQFRSAIAILRDHPLTGIGVGAFGTAWRVYQHPLFARDQLNAVHSLYLNVAAETGLPGLLVGGWLLWTLAQTWWRSWRATTPGSRTWWRLLGNGAALIGLAAQSTVDYFLADPAILLPVCFIVADLLVSASPTDAPPHRPWRWAWGGTAAFLLLSAIPLAWDDIGYGQMTASLAAMQRGDLAAAEAAIERAVQHDPGMPLYACQLGYVYGLQAYEGERSALDKAIEKYQRCISSVRSPGWADQLNMAALLVQAGRWDEAKLVLDRAVGRSPLQPLLWLNHALVAEQVGNWAEAVRDYAWVLHLKPEWAGSPFWQNEMRAAHWAEIMAYGEPIEAGEPDWYPHVLAAAQRWDELSASSQAQLAQNPDDAAATYWLGEALRGQGDPTAVEWLSRAVELNPTNDAVWAARGLVRLERGEATAADADFGMTLFLNPANPTAHLGRARLARLRGDDEQALREYRQALSPYLVVVHGYDYVLYRRSGWPATLPQVSRLTHRLDGEVAQELGTWLEARGEREMALQVYRLVLSLDPSWQSIRERMENLGVHP